MESVWAPHGFTVFLTWLVDPQWNDHRPVWAIGTCLQHPTGRLEAEGDPLMPINHWPRYLPVFLAGLAALRDEPLRKWAGSQG